VKNEGAGENMPGGKIYRLLDEVGVSPAWQRTALVVARTLSLLAVLGVAVFVVGLVVGDGLVWIGLALFVGSAVLWSVVLWAMLHKIAKVRWQEGTVTFRTVEPGEHTEYGWRVDCEVELNPTGRITWVHTEKEIWGSALQEKRLVVGATMRCLIDRTEIVAFRAFPWAKPDGDPLPSSRRSAAWWTSGDKWLFQKGKSRKR
jgi:hypothetical protein